MLPAPMMNHAATNTAPNNPPVLEVDSVQCSFGHQRLLTDVYLKCQQGQIIGLLGRNGSGKSTLLKIIFGTQAAENSLIRINGKVYKEPFRSQLINYLPQHNYLPTALSVQKIISLFVASPAKRDRLQTHPFLVRHLSKRLGALSGGESRYFQLLLLLQLEAPFLLLDEPFSGIEPKYREEIIQLLLAYKAQKGMLMTDHDFGNILAVSDQIKLLVNGACKPIRHVQELEQWQYVPKGTFPPR